MNEHPNKNDTIPNEIDLKFPKYNKLNPKIIKEIPKIFLDNKSSLR